MSDLDFTWVLLALAHLLIAAHAVGYVFQRLRQPRVIGEIVGGLLLGPTVFGSISPVWFDAVFSNRGSVVVLGALNKLGLMLLMFISGLEMRSEFGGAARRSVLAITVLGTIVPFGIALVVGQLIDFSPFYGRSSNAWSFQLVVAIAAAVTSIPVISKVMLDLGILNTAFARIVLSVAVLEDVLLYVVLAIALSLTPARASEQAFGLPHLLGVHEGPWNVAYHVVATLCFFVLALTTGPNLFGRLNAFRFNVVRRGSQTGYLLTCLIVTSAVAMFLKVQLMFGAFLAGVVAGTSSDDADGARTAVKQFASAFFIPIYFAIVGLRLNLLRGTPWLAFLCFLVVCCVVKAASVFAGARLAGVSRAGSVNLAAAMNARGGPGIVLATVAFEAGIVDERFYACLVLLAIITSLVAGQWLSRVVRLKRALL